MHLNLDVSELRWIFGSLVAIAALLAALLARQRRSRKKAANETVKKMREVLGVSKDGRVIPRGGAIAGFPKRY